MKVMNKRKVSKSKIILKEFRERINRRKSQTLILRNKFPKETSRK